MDLRISVAVLLIFLSGGYSLKCYSCETDRMGSCEEKVDVCGDGFYKCENITREATLPQHMGSRKLTYVKKHCARTCEPGTQSLPNGETETTRCCDTDLCNAAGSSLKCYSCKSDLTTPCEEKVDTCGYGFSKCRSITRETIIPQHIGSGKMTIVKKQCARTCEPGAQKLPYGVTETTRCCDTDLCNAADGVYKGPFLLLLSPLFFYFLFH